jgi:hypothetical protein
MFETICFELKYFESKIKILKPKFSYSLNLFVPLALCSPANICLFFSFPPGPVGIPVPAHPTARPSAAHTLFIPFLPSHCATATPAKASSPCSSSGRRASFPEEKTVLPVPSPFRNRLPLCSPSKTERNNGAPRCQSFLSPHRLPYHLPAPIKRASASQSPPHL